MLDKNMLYEKLENLYNQKNDLDKQIQNVNEQLNKIQNSETEQYLNQCFKAIRDDNFIVYYKILKHSDHNPYAFTTLVIDTNLDIIPNFEGTYVASVFRNLIYVTDLPWLGDNKSFMKSKISISQEEFNEVLKDFSSKIQNINNYIIK